MQTSAYRLAVLSDIHIDLENGGKNTYFIHAERNLRRALEVIRAYDCSLLISAGDQVTNATGAEEEWRRYRQILTESGYTGQVLEAMGNHESRYAQYGGCTIEDCRREFVRFTRLAEKPVLRPKGARDGTAYYAYLDDHFGDAFLFLALENGCNTNQIDNFSDEQMDWAEELLARYTREGRRIFLIQHAPLYGDGVGDNRGEPAYEGSIRLSDAKGRVFQNNRRFHRLTRQYPEMIRLSGHTHVDLRDKVNYRRDGCHRLHIPSLAGSTRLTKRDGKPTLDRTFYGDAAQGYLAEVEEARVIFRGIDFLHRRFYPEFTYTIERKQNHLY